MNTTEQFKTRRTMFAVGITLVSFVFTVPAADGQESRQIRARAVPVQSTSAGPVTLLPENMCDPSGQRQTRRGDVTTYSCTERDPSEWLAAATKPGVRAGITGECEDDGNGKPTNCKWNCVKDEDSDCSVFITACVDNDGTVEGNKNGATCNP